MKPTPNLTVERYRLREGAMGSSRFDGNNGQFAIPMPNGGPVLLVIVSDGGGWEHVSVTLMERRKRALASLNRTPTWAEMDYVKRLFWQDDETVVQFHVPRAEHVNVHEYCLHLWRPVDGVLSVPDPAFVG